MIARTSTDRLPTDHFISGALFGAITSIAATYTTSNNKHYKDLSMDVAKAAIKGGVAGGLSITASNLVVEKRYIDATLSIALAAGLLVMTDSVFNKLQSKEVK